MINKIKFYWRCIKIVWEDRGTRSCRQKSRRLLREFERAGKELELNS
ncbi:hypothetical protein [Anaerosolibacter sp.]